jgi:predicted nucleic acid-binding protein
VSDFVLDASVTLAWLIDTSIDPYALRVRRLLLKGQKALVPSLWQLEVANGFIVAEKRAILAGTETEQILQNFQAVLGTTIQMARDPISTVRVISTARTFGLTAYDAAYLQLASQEQLPIATLDRGLAQAAKRAGVSLVQ